MVIIERKTPALPYLRFQVGEMIERAENEPIYFEGKLVGQAKTNNPVKVFRLRGCGKTLADAYAMAAKIT